ncbi:MULTISPECIES: glycosyltransferase [unclassified Arthrobacter]|uniref:glycosyltransferase n=1 Tax=unclassified Arthrobacter TaxID=235627 RepID=UPI001C8433D2|nr:glycosyltransferase [Arthrobacter sp. MAHUQ-56]MBX7444918.1 glycosyltransferase [Arthrobacter sp. MAHUQ-56]
MPRISIVTISYNQVAFLPYCLESIRSQGFQDYEHIIVDPGSTDGSREIARSRADPKIKLIFEADSGPADGLNKGLAAATGDIFIYLNADDELPPRALQRLSDLHEEHSGSAILIGNGWTIDDEGRPIAYVMSDKFTPYRYALSVGTVLQQATSFKRQALTGLRFNEENRVNWDTEFLFDALGARLTISNVRDCLGYFRLQDDSITVSGRYAAQLTAKRQSLIKLNAGLPAYLSGRLLAPLARIAKKSRTTAYNAVSRPVFPGLSRVQKEF